ncbi:hypothetical protein glysoja_045540 [Glycine soja]|uniref:Uncharacterized protein n=2 Tax=Glycine soja TaxID=3848 RepID=A0A0B2QIY2_GLYSO|nr:hypothetical protein glysoja_045540 [Glycine soja]
MNTSENGGCLLPGDSHPDWWTFHSEDSSVIFEIPQVNKRNLKTMMCHVHYSSPVNIATDGLKNLLVINHTKTTIQLYKSDALASLEDEEWQRAEVSEPKRMELGSECLVIDDWQFGITVVARETIIVMLQDICSCEPDGNYTVMHKITKFETMETGNLVLVDMVDVAFG